VSEGRPPEEVRAPEGPTEEARYVIPPVLDAERVSRWLPADLRAEQEIAADRRRETWERLEALEGAKINDAKIVLANEATKLCHGPEAALTSAETARQTFVEGGLGEELPNVEISKSELEKGVRLYELLRRAGLTSSNSEGRRLIKGGGARVNDKVIEDEEYSVTRRDFANAPKVKLSSGKKRHATVSEV